MSSLTDALVALGRISKFLLSEELAEPYLLDYGLKQAVKVDGDFAWETAGKLEGKFAPGVGEKTDKKRAKKAAAAAPILPTTVDEKEADPETRSKEEEEEKPFELRDLKLSVPKGAFVAIVGRVGSGKVRACALRLWSDTQMCL